MRKRASGSGRARLKREEPREIAPSSAATEPPGRSPEPVFYDDNILAGKSETRPAADRVPLSDRRQQGKNVRMPSEFVPRLVVTDQQWRRVKPFLIVKGKRGRTAKDLRKLLRASFGSSAPARRGGTCMGSLASGTPFIRHSGGCASGARS